MVSTRGSQAPAAPKASDAVTLTPTAPKSTLESRETRSSKGTHLLDESPNGAASRGTKKRKTAASPPPETASEPVQQTTEVIAENEEDAPSDPIDMESEYNMMPQLGLPPDFAALDNGTTNPYTPDLDAAISNIIGHSERLDAHALMSETNPSNSKGLVYVKTGSRMKVESLPILDNLATQILSTLAKSSYQEIIALVAEPDSEAGQEYSTVRSLFDHTKRVYSTKSSFLSAKDLDMNEPSQIDVLRKANLASFVSSIFGTQEIGFSEMNEHFLEIFVPENGRLLKAQGSIFLELKTQAFIASMHTEERSKTDLLFQLFPDDLETQLLGRRPGARGLAPSETDFVKRAQSRRDFLLSEINNEGQLAALPEKYQWEDFLRELSGYVSKNFDNINAQHTRKPSKSRPSMSNGDGQEVQQNQLESNFVINTSQAGPADLSTDKPKTQEDFVAKAARAAALALNPAQNMSPHPPQGFPHHMHHSGPHNFQQAQIHPNFQQYTPPIHPPMDVNTRQQSTPSYGPLPELPHVSQTAPTQVLYERARMAATSKSSPTSRRAGLPSQRRPWTTEEENALMAGLDRVRGPHWSQILAMFGPGGTINESLKDRNQVQLKDKARNLKLFFLKSGIEVPYYLKYVTGDLKTRAPAQASKNEAREREKQQGEEDKAHFDGVQGIMALAGANPQFGEGDPEAMAQQQMMEQPMLDANIDPKFAANFDPNMQTMSQPSESTPTKIEG